MFDLIMLDCRLNGISHMKYDTEIDHICSRILQGALLLLTTGAAYTKAMRKQPFFSYAFSLFHF